MYQKILVPLDGSARAERILPHVEELALNFGATIILFHVIQPNSIYTEPADSKFNLEAMERQEKEIENYLNANRGELAGKGISVQARIEHGAIAPTIDETAKLEEVDLIAMASHGRGGLARVFYGSVASALLQRVDRPLLLVRSRRA